MNGNVVIFPLMGFKVLTPMKGCHPDLIKANSSIRLLTYTNWLRRTNQENEHGLMLQTVQSSRNVEYKTGDPRGLSRT